MNRYFFFTCLLFSLFIASLSSAQSGSARIDILEFSLDLSETPFTPTPTPIGPDTDGDGIADILEARVPGPGMTNKYLPDSDGDGLWDGIEDLNRNGIHLDPGETDPRDWDTDGDGYEDGIEVLLLASDPLEPESPDIPFMDSDGDLLPDFLDPEPFEPDADGDRFLDGYEAVILGLSSVLDPGLTPTLGDVNQDGYWDNADVQLILNFFGDIPVHPSVSFDFTRTDLDRNGIIDNADAQHLLNYFAYHRLYLPVIR